MLALGVSRVRLEGERREALVPADVGSDLDHEGKIGGVQDFDGAAHGVRRRLRADLAEQSQRLDPLAQVRAAKRLTDVACAVSLQGHDDPAQREVGRVDHGPTPAGVTAAAPIVHERGVRASEPTHGFEVVG